MSKIADQAYLRNEQYNNAAKLHARIALHERFSTNAYGWHRWVWDQFDLPPTACVLEIGCGPGTLWMANKDRIPSGWDVTLSDFSEGMLAEARLNLSRIHHPFHFANADAQALPFPGAHFDAVIANHMLYHVPERERAYGETKRVLRPGGRLFAATNGRTHLQELDDIVRSFDPQLVAWTGRPPLTFRLETGAAELERWFENVELRRYPNALVVTEADPLVAFILSMAHAHDFDAARRAALHAHIEQQIAAHGPLHITKDTGVFIATKGNT
jgi:ubiquinone/menaquinone biosynthesis C-methylase UbiE